jgi:lipid II:glycine glycyltransferase (peptidoglycan interpeptide bridge formation enzyme)
LLDAIIDKLESISASYYELRAFRNQDLIIHPRLKCHYYNKIHILHIGDGFEKTKRSFRKDVVSSAKKAVREGVTIRQGHSEQDLKQYYFIHATTRRRLGFPIQPYKLFKNMFEIMYPAGYLTVLLAEYKQTTIAGSVLFKYKDTVILEHSASIPKYLRLRPNHLLVWSAIETACSEGYHYFDFGKTPPENKGLLDFKSRWGGKIFDVPYFYYPEIKGIMALEQKNLKHRMFRLFLRYMPITLAKIFGKIVYQHLG